MANQLNENNVAEFVGQVVDILEDYLEARDITPDMLPNPDKEGDEDAAIIFSTDYDIIDDAVRCEIDMAEFVETDNVVNNSYTQQIIIEHIYEGYQEVAEKINGYDLDATDERCLKDQIGDLFIEWGLFE